MKVKPKKMGRRIMEDFLAAAVLCGSILFYAWALEPEMLRTREFTIWSPDLPASQDGLRVALLSDFHHLDPRSLRRIERAIQKANDLHPDLTVIAGDFTIGGPRSIPGLEPALKKLSAPLGVYAVLGNHDYTWYQGERMRALLTRSGVRLLENEGVWLDAPPGGPRFRLCGVGDLWNGRQDLKAALGGAGRSDFVLLLSHNPDYAALLPAGAADAMLSGHTHGGQVALFGWAPFLPIVGGQKLRSGLARVNGVQVIVSRGVGMIFPRLRLGSPPDLVLVEFKKGEAP